MTDFGRLDSVRSKMLADMGIEVWLQRDSVAPPSRLPAAPPPAPAEQRSMARPGASIGPEPVPMPTAAPTLQPLPLQLPPQRAVLAEPEPLAVTCLVNGSVVMLIGDAQSGISRRLCQDLLAGVTGDWTSSPQELTFTWPAGMARDEGWRAFKAFADKQLREANARCVLCSEAMVDRLPELPRDCRVLALPELCALGVAGKRALWRRIQTLKR